MTKIGLQVEMGSSLSLTCTSLMRQVAEPRLQRPFDSDDGRVEQNADRGQAEQGGEGQRRVDLRVRDQHQLAEAFVRADELADDSADDGERDRGLRASND